VAFFGQVGASAPAASADHAHPFAPITWPEKTGTALLLATTLLIGLKPDLLLNWIVPSLQSPLLRAIWHGGAQ
jgi:NADH-quinone oxidoreductase subunit M